MEDDLLAAEVLLRLRQTSPPPPSDRPPHALHVDWIVRQRRSKSVTRNVELEKKKQPTRASPTTPLSWSGVTSASCGGTEGLEESSRLPRTFVGARSEKVVKNNEGARRKRKRTKGKKSLVELKEEQTFLMKERKSLNRALKSFRLNLEKQRAINQRLKRIKVGLNYTISSPFMSSQQVSVLSESPPSTSDQPSTPLAVAEVNQHPFPSKANLKQLNVQTLNTASLLPDLNLPSRANPCPEFLQETRRST